MATEQAQQQQVEQQQVEDDSIVIAKEKLLNKGEVYILESTEESANRAINGNFIERGLTSASNAVGLDGTSTIVRIIENGFEGLDRIGKLRNK